MKHAFLISLFLTAILFADFKVGDKLPTITLADQFEKEYKVEAKDRLVIMAFEKDISIAFSTALLDLNGLLNSKLLKQTFSNLISPLSFFTFLAPS